MASISAKCLDRLGYIISKGGITTHILLSKGLMLRSVDLKGQVLPGLSIVCQDNYSSSIKIPVVKGTFCLPASSNVCIY